MKDVIIAESCVQNERGYMDMTAETIGNSFVIRAEDHDDYAWTARCSVKKVLRCLIEAMGTDKVKEVLNELKVKEK